MAAIIIAPCLGGLVGAAVYYTVSTTISSKKSYLRSELHQLSNTLTSHTSSPSSFHALPSPTPLPTPELSEIIKERWNTSLSSIVSSLETTDWARLGTKVWGVGEGLIERVQGVTGGDGGKIGGVVVGKQRVGEVQKMGLGGEGVSTERRVGLEEKVPVVTEGLASGKRLV